MRPIGIEAQTAFGMPPVEYVALAGELGCAHVSLGLGPMPWNPCNFAPWSLRDDAALRRELKEVMAATGVTISLAEGFAVRPQVEARDRVADMDILADLGAQRIGAVVMDQDSSRALDQLATLADLAAERGMGFVLEFAPPHPVNNLAAALAAIRHIDKPNVGLVIDAMHLFRSGGTLTDLAAVNPADIAYVQLCDVPMKPVAESYLAEASHNRRIPGQGELPLEQMLTVLPRNVPVGLEVPMQSRIEAGETLSSIIHDIVDGARILVSKIEQ